MGIEMKYTPGPWKLAQENGKLGVVGVTTSGKFIALTGITGEQCIEAERQANARLIAAAPDLLGALMDAVSGGDWNIDRARAAIAKATGKELAA